MSRGKNDQWAQIVGKKTKYQVQECVTAYGSQEKPRKLSHLMMPIAHSKSLKQFIHQAKSSMHDAYGFVFSTFRFFYEHTSFSLKNNMWIPGLIVINLNQLIA